MINNLQNTNFGTKILVSQKKFNAKNMVRLMSEDKYLQPSFSVFEPDAKILRGEGISLGAWVCSMAILKPKIIKPDSNFFFCHVIPLAWGQEIKKGILAAKEGLQKPSSELSAFLIGAEKQDQDSMRHAGYFMDAFEKEGIEYSALVGQKSEMPYSDLYYNVSKDEATIDFKGAEGIQTFNDLNGVFDIVKIAKGDVLDIGGLNDK